MSHFGVLKCRIPPSSSELCWGTVAGLLGLSVRQMSWNPPSVSWSEPRTPLVSSGCFSTLQAHYKFHDEHYDEAGKLPLASILLSGALLTYPNPRNRRFYLLPQYRVMGSDYKCDYAITVAEKVYRCWIYHYMHSNILLHFNRVKTMLQ